MKKIAIDDLMLYEMPSHAEYIHWGWVQSIVGYLMARKVIKKMERYNVRKARERFLADKA